MKGELIPPEPQKRWAKVKPKKPFIIHEPKDEVDDWEKSWLTSGVA